MMPKRRTSPKTVSSPGMSAVTSQSILDIITARYDGMSPGLRSVSDYILRNPSTFFFLTVQELAAKAGVSHATVIRFCKALGYKGFYEFSRDVQQVIQAELSLVTRLDIAPVGRTATEEKPSVIREILDAEIAALASTAELVTGEDIHRAALMLDEADQIFVIGLMASLSLSTHLEQMLGKVADNVHLVPSWSLQTAAMLSRTTAKSVLVAFAYPRYPTVTVDYTMLAREKGCKVIAITNSQLSPLAKYADMVLCAPINFISYVDLYSAPLSVATALAIEFSRLHHERTAERLKQFDKTVAHQHLFTR